MGALCWVPQGQVEPRTPACWRQAAPRALFPAGCHTHLDVLLGDTGPRHFLLPFPYEARDGAIRALVL